jgi:Tol biopolymer transport system component
MFVAIWSPRFSPDGKHILFTANGGDRSKPRLNVQPLTTNNQGWVPRVAAHGYPMDLWLVDVETGQLELLAALAADDPYATWSPDGQHIALMSAAGLFLLDLTTGALTPLTNSPGFGAVDWHAGSRQ